MQIVPKMSNNSNTKQSSSPSCRDLETLRERYWSLRDKNDILEDELSKMKADQVSWDFERSRLLRELEVLDHNLKDLTRELGLKKESETNAIKRYGRAVEYSREVEAKMEALQRGVEEERGEILGKLSVLKDELMEREAELKDSRKMNKVWEGELGELRGKNEELGKELGKIEAVVREKDEEIEELKSAKVELLERIRVLENEELKSEKDELLERIRVLENEKLEIVINKDRKIEELKEELLAIDKMAEERYLKLQNDVATHCWSVAKKGVIFETSLNEKILSLVDNALDDEPENDVVVNEVEITGNLDAAFVNHVNVLKCEETVKTTVLSSEEPIGETGEACPPKSQSPVCIEISDSDDDEISHHVSGLKRARDDTSSDGSQNPKRKMKKLACVLGEVATLRKCNSTETNILEYMQKHRKQLMKNEVVDVADMVLACQKDPEFCTKAVCAVFRNDLLSSGQKECKKRAIDSSITMTSLRQMDIRSDSRSHRDEDEIVEDEPLPTSQTQPRERIYLSHQPGGVWWDDPRIVNLLGCSFTSTYETYVTNWTDCPPAQRDAMFNYFQEGVTIDKGYDLRKAYEARIKKRMTCTIYEVATTAKRPTWMPVACFERLLRRKDDPKFQTKAEKAKANRLTGGKDGKALPTHVLGRQSAARAFRKMGPLATPYQLFEASKKKGGKWINPRSEEVDAVYQIKKAQFDAGEITADELHLYIESAGGFNKNHQVFGLGGVARELFTPS